MCAVRWEWALDVLENMSSMQCLPDAISCTAAMNACAKAAEWEASLELLAKTTVDNYVLNAALNSCEKAGRWDIALNILEKFAPLAGLITYNAAIGSCKQDGRWKRCLLLWQDLLARGLQPDVITYNCAIGSCQVAGEWVVALSLFNAMCSTSTVPDGTTYTELLGALEKTNQWTRALHIFSMASQQLEPDGTLTGSVAGAVSAAKGPNVAMSLLRTMLKRWRRSAGEGDDALVVDAEVLERRPGVVVLYKPSGLSMEALMNKAFGMRWMAVVQTVSRLDYPTSGVVPVALGTEGSVACNWLQAQFSAKLVKKENLSELVNSAEPLNHLYV